VRIRGSALRALAACVLLSTAPALADWERVPIELPVPPELDLPAGERVLVALFRSNDHSRFYPGREISRFVKTRLRRETQLEVIDVTPPPIPEQRPEVLAVNDVFWKQLGEDFEADVIVAGVARYDIEDRSGFVSRDFRDPRTGQTVRRTVYQEQTLYRLRVQIFFLKGANGALLHSDVWTEERIVRDDVFQEDLQSLNSILDRMAPRLRAVLEPTKVVEPRFVWID
jgi:hypothetical protein